MLRGLLDQLDGVAVGVREGAYPTSPVLLLRWAYELHALAFQPFVLSEDVVHSKVGHEPKGVLSGAFDPVVEADIEPDVPQLKGQPDKSR